MLYCYYDPDLARGVKDCADSWLLSGKNDPVIKYACIFACESGYYRALNRVL